MGGDRPRNHVQAKYVTVIDRAEGCIKYFCLDSKGCLVFEDGFPKLCKTEPFLRSVPPPPPPPEPESQPEPPVDLVFEPEVPQLDGDNFGAEGQDVGFVDFYGGNAEGDFSAYEAWNPYLM
jgi:hypothetical protein